MSGRRATRDDSEEPPPSFQPEGLPDDHPGQNPAGELRSRSFGTRDQETFATTSPKGGRCNGQSPRGASDRAATGPSASESGTVGSAPSNRAATLLDCRVHVDGRHVTRIPKDRGSAAVTEPLDRRCDITLRDIRRCAPRNCPQP